MIALRIVWSIALLVLGFIIPWWLFVVLLCVGFLFFPYYIEGIIVAGLFDSVFALPGSFPYMYTIIAVFLFVGMYYARRYMSFI